MNNLQVITRFLEGKPGQTNLRNVLNGVFIYKGRTLTTNGKDLINYSTVIGYKKEGKLYLNKNKYSVTTSKIQNMLEREAQNYYSKENIIYYENGKIIEK